MTYRTGSIVAVLRILVLGRLHGQAALLSVAERASITSELTALERQSWVAWQARDGKFFDNFLSEDHIDVGAMGTSGKAGIVRFVGSPACVVTSYQLDSIATVVFDAHAAVLTYRLQQDTKCGGTAVPSPVWVTSLYLRRDSHWHNALFSQIPAR